jgi:polyisoprenoid-binding protein YceI
VPSITRLTFLRGLVIVPVAAACAPAAPAAQAPAATSTPAAQPTTAPAATPAPSGSPAAGGAAVRYTIVPADSEARYKAREVLVGRTLANDAIGRTKQVSGAISFLANGQLDPANSTITVNLASVASDSGPRDNFIRGTTLNTNRWPNATFAIKSVKGLPAALPNSGEFQIELVGDLTIRDRTNSSTWTGTAKFASGTLTGSAKTIIRLPDYGTSKPQVPAVASIEDDITLEIDVTARIAA